MLSLSPSGAEFIARFEGFSAFPYRDAAGHLTIGYGHLIAPGENWTHISEGEALDLLMQDAARNAAPVDEQLLYPIPQHQADALISLAFNVGGYAVARSTLLRLLNAGLPDTEIAAEFLRLNKAGGRVLRGRTRRREAEQRLFLTGEYQ